MSWIADQFGLLFSVQGHIDAIEMQRQKIASLELTIGDQLRSINCLVGQNLQLRERIRGLETDCRMALNAMRHALESQEQSTEEPGERENTDQQTAPG